MSLLGSGCARGDGAAGETTSSTADAGTTRTTEPSCEEGGRTVERGGLRVHQFCGPARARLTIDEATTDDEETDGDTGTRTVEFSGGTCVRGPDRLEVDIGAEVVGSATVEDADDDADEDAAGDDVEARDGGGTAPRFESFTLLLGRHRFAREGASPVRRDGIHNEGVVTFAVPGTNYALDDETFVLVAARIGGSFSGTGFADTGEARPLEVRGTFTCDTSVLPLDEVRTRVETRRDGEEDPEAPGTADDAPAEDL